MSALHTITSKKRVITPQQSALHKMKINALKKRGYEEIIHFWQHDKSVKKRMLNGLRSPLQLQQISIKHISASSAFFAFLPLQLQRFPICKKTAEFIHALKSKLSPHIFTPLLF